MPRRRPPVEETPKANNRGKASMGQRQRPGPPVPRGNRLEETPRHRHSGGGRMDNSSSGQVMYRRAEESSEEEEEESHIDIGIDEEEEEEEEGSESYASEIDLTDDEEEYSEGEDDDVDSQESHMHQGDDRFDDEYVDSGPASFARSSSFARDSSSVTPVIEFTGMEAVAKIEKQRKAAAAAPSGGNPTPGKATGPGGGGDLLKQYMGVLHGSGPVSKEDAEGIENKIAQGLSSHRGRSDFILNSNSDNMSVGTKSTRQSRREAVMVAQRINFLEDDPAEMTYTRRIALHLMKKYKWYNPRLGEPPEEIDENEATQMGGAFRTKDGYPMKKVKPENPSLESAWAYFEHFTLTRFVYEPKPLTQKSRCERITSKLNKGDFEIERAERNENILPTKLYEPFWTPHNQLGDWGIGWGLYFASLRGTMVLCFVAGLCSIPNMIYFGGKSFSDGEPAANIMLAASAVCTDTEWVPCPQCAGLQKDEIPIDRLAYFEHSGLGLNLTYALKNNCNGTTLQAGMVNFGVLCVVLLGLFVLNRYLMKMEAIFDGDEQSAQHYTVVIKNPPDDATDPEEWRNFFIKNLGVAHVVAVTVSVDNDDLVKKIVERRENMKLMELLLDPGTELEMNNLAGIAAKEDRTRGALASFLSMFIPGIPELFRRIVVLTIDIRGLAQHDYPAMKVFVTFETEADQRRVVEEMAVGKFYIRSDDKSVVKDPKYLFRGEHMLYVHEPVEEPNSYRWISMNERNLDRLWQQTLTTIATFASICLVAFIVRIVHDRSNVLSAIAISLFNAAFPEFAKILVKFEGHSTEAAVQTSMYIKICLFRWTNTAIVITIITPFTATLYSEAGGLLPQIYALFFSEIITLNVLQLLDGPGHFMRHVMAPRAKTQDEMNLQMKGLEVELAERYTNMTKILFLALWYSSVYPVGLFMASFALFINYYTDRHSLMRTWKRSPPLGAGISEFSRRYFVTTSWLAMALMSSYFWASFPFDNLCPDDKVLPPSFAQGTNFSITRYGPPFDKIKVTVFEDSTRYRFCNQDMLRLEQGRNFPFIPENQPPGSEWMTEEQETVTSIYGWAAVGAIILVSAMFVQGWIEQISKFVWGERVNLMDDQRINFSDVTNISAYIPQVPSDVFSYPLFVCNVDEIGEEVIDWRDPRRPHSFYDLTKDAEKILEGIDISNKLIFSQMKHWPPETNNDGANFNNALSLGGGVAEDEDLSDSEEDSLDFEGEASDFIKQMKTWKSDTNL